MSQNIYTESWKKILREAAKAIANGEVRISYPATQITSLGKRDRAGHTMKFTSWGGKCSNYRNSTVFQDLRIVYEAGTEFKNRFPGALDITLNANNEIIISHRFLTYEDYIQRYREQQMSGDLHKEKYKFKLIQSFQAKWNKYEQGRIAFAEVMSGSPFGNLLYMGMVPSIFNHLLKENPAALEQILLALYDETQPLNERIDKYVSDFATTYFSLNNAGKNHGQDPRTVATLLTFRHPDKYTLFKYGFYRPLSRSMGAKPKEAFEQLTHYYTFVRELVNELNNHPDIFQWEANNLDAECYPDPNHLLLAQDIFYTLLDSKDSEPEMSEDNDDGDDYTKKTKQKTQKMNYPLNLILYGPPGTGKTYNSINRAVAIANPNYDFSNKTRYDIKIEYDSLVRAGRIEFCTFHQSMNYEDFIEGIKPLSDNGMLHYEIVPGIFKKIAARAAYVPDQQTTIFSVDKDQFDNAEFYKMSLGSTQHQEDDEIYRYCIDNNYIALGWGGEINYTGQTESEVNQTTTQAKFQSFERGAIRKFIHGIRKGDFVIVSNGNHSFRAIGKVIGEYEYRPDEIDYPHLRKVQWLLKNEDIPAEQIYDRRFSQKSIYNLDKNGIKRNFFVKTENNIKPNQSDTENFVLIIDEINRGNVSAIFGELITLIEENKRKGMKEELNAILPYSRESFNVPSNLYIIGTMNTADRSVEALDTALRRRFSFEEMMPLEGLDEIRTVNIAGIDFDFKEVLYTINKRLNKLIGRDHSIGHSYLMCEKAEDWEFYLRAFKDKIIPLLQEYFYNDYAKMCLVIGKGFTDLCAVLLEEDETKFFADAMHDALDDFKSKQVWEIKNISTEDEFAIALTALLNK